MRFSHTVVRNHRWELLQQNHVIYNAHSTRHPFSFPETVTWPRLYGFLLYLPCYQYAILLSIVPRFPDLEPFLASPSCVHVPQTFTPGGVSGDISASLVSATALSAVGGSRSEDGEAGGGSEGDATLYAALLRLAMQARGSHGVMDASQLKRAMDRHS